MKSLIDGFFVSVSMYSIIPVKKNIIWDKNSMKYAFCFLPFIGALAGGAELLWLFLCIKLDLDKNLYAAFSTAIPIIITGGIHIDGFLDTADAYFSYADISKKLEILKDPHIGAFSLIYYGILILCEFGLYSQLYSCFKYKYALALSFVISRAMGGLIVVSTKCADGSQSAKIFSENADKNTVKAVLWIIAAVIFVFNGFYYGFFGVFMSAIFIAFYFYYKKMCRVKFGGINGDMAGCFIILSELAALALCCFGGAVI